MRAGVVSGNRAMSCSSKWVTFAAVCLLCAAAAGAGQQGAFSRADWLEDLEVVRSAFATKYPDLEWEVFERGVRPEQGV